MVDYSCLRDCWNNYNKITSLTNLNSREIIKSYIKPGMRILDFGCGKEGTIDGIKTDRYDTDTSIDCYHNLNDIKVIYDLIIFSHVIEHANLDEAIFMLQWCINHSKQVILATPNSCCIGFDFWKDLTHKRPYSTPQTCAIIENLGGKIQKVQYAYHGELKTLPFRLITALGKDEKLKALYYEYVVVFSGC